jgi:hypothetical protein
MTQIRLHIVANNCKWKSWPDKIRDLQAWFDPLCDLVVSLEHTNLKNIPYESYGTSDGEERMGIEWKWYDENVSWRGKDAQLVMFVESWEAWRGTGAAGWRTDATYGPVELQVAANEHTNWYWQFQNTGNWFVNVARHEILHGLFLMTGQPDTVHYWWDQWKLENARDEISLFRWSIYKALDTAYTSLRDTYQKLISLHKDPMDTLIEAIIQVESGGDDNAIGDRHLINKAYGPMQIRKPYVDDVNRIYKTTYRAEDCLGNRDLSIDLFKKYMAIYATAKLLGHEPTQEDMARIHNGGPNGWKKLSTVPYWYKVKKYL